MCCTPSLHFAPIVQLLTDHQTFYELKQYKKGIKAADAILKKLPNHGGECTAQNATDARNNRFEGFDDSRVVALPSHRLIR